MQSAPATGTAATPPAASPPRATEPAAVGDETFYVLTLHDEIVITQGTGTTRRTAEGTSLSLTFTFRSEALDAGLASAPAA